MRADSKYYSNLIKFFKVNNKSLDFAIKNPTELQDNNNNNNNNQ